MTSRAITAEAKNLLLDLIETLQDGHKGMMDLGQRLQRESARQFLLRQSQVRAEFAAELENQLHRMGEADVEQRGTIGGALHRVWSDVKAKLGADDESLLASAELGEVGTEKAYPKALQESMPGDVRDLVTTQQSAIRDALDQLRNLRSGKAA